MRSFSEYYEDLENKKPLNEDVFTYIVTGVIGLPILVAMSWGAAWSTQKYVSFTKKLFNNLINTMKSIKSLFKKDSKVAEKKIEKTVTKIEQAPEVKKAIMEVEKFEDKYRPELNSIYEAFKNKDIDEAEKLFKELPVNLQENPEVRVALINVIIREYEEQPLYVTSPGNEPYQAIKRLFGQKVARAMEELGRRGFDKYYQRVETVEVEHE